LKYQIYSTYIKLQHLFIRKCKLYLWSIRYQTFL